MSTYDITTEDFHADATSAPRDSDVPVFVLYVLHFAFLVLLMRPAELWPPLASIRPVLISFAALVLAWLLTGKKTVLFHHRISYLAAGLLGAMVLSAPMSYWAGQSVKLSINFLEQLVAIVLLLNIVRSKHDFVQFAGVFVFANAFHAALLMRNAVSGSYDGRVFGTAGGIFSDPNDLALNFVVTIPFAFWALRQCRRMTSKLFFYLMLALLVGGLVASQSRGGMIGAFAMCCLLSLGWSRKLPLIMTLLIAGGAVLLLAPAEFLDRFSTVGQYHNDESSQSRFYVWKQGLRMWGDHPLLGVGLGSFQLAYGLDYLGSDAPTNMWLAAHNSVIHVAAELGTIGLLCWVGMILAGFSALRQVRQWKGWLNSSSYGSQLTQLAVALRAALIGYLVCGLFISRSYDWMILVILASCILCWQFAATYIADELEDDEVDCDNKEIHNSHDNMATIPEPGL